MTSVRQIAANQRNAERSTGPKTEKGKLRSRRNALRHGLCAETVIEILEDIGEYRAFELAIIADFSAETAVERELALRLASLLWRLRRATSIETDLMQFQAEIVRKIRTHDRAPRHLAPDHRATDHGRSPKLNGDRNIHDDSSSRTELNDFESAICTDLAHSFQRLNNLDNGAFERIGRYESALWRQVAQLLFVLRPRRRRSARL